MVSHIVLLYNKIMKQIMFFFQGGPSENDISVDIIYLITNESCHHVLKNDKTSVSFPLFAVQKVMKIGMHM